MYLPAKKFFIYISVCTSKYYFKANRLFWFRHHQSENKKYIFFSKILLSTIPQSFIKLNMKNRKSRQQHSYINIIQKDGYSARILTLNEDRMIHLHDPLERLKNGKKESGKEKI